MELKEELRLRKQTESELEAARRQLKNPPKGWSAQDWTSSRDLNALWDKPPSPSPGRSPNPIRPPRPKGSSFGSSPSPSPPPPESPVKERPQPPKRTVAPPAPPIDPTQLYASE